MQLIVAGKLHIAPWGTFVDARVPGAIHSGLPGGDHAAAQLNLETTVRNDEAVRRNFMLISQVVDPAGKVVASRSTEEELEPGVESTFTQQLALADALLWSLEHPNLYWLRTTLRAGNASPDEKTTSFGIRTLRFDPDKGFFLNGKRVEIRGMCVHQDFPGVGVAAPANLWRWRIRRTPGDGHECFSHGSRSRFRQFLRRRRPHGNAGDGGEPALGGYLFS